MDLFGIRQYYNDRIRARNLRVLVRNSEYKPLDLGRFVINFNVALKHKIAILKIKI